MVPVFGLALGALVLHDEFTLAPGVVAAFSIVGMSLANKPKRLRIRSTARRNIKRAQVAAVRGIHQVMVPRAGIKAPPVRYTNQRVTPQRPSTGFLG